MNWIAAPAAAPDVHERARRIRLLSCDVDGVLTDGRILMCDDGSQIKAFSSLDGLGIKWLQQQGIVVAWISGSRAASVSHRARDLGVEHVVLGAEDKLTPWERLRAQLGIGNEACAHIGDDLPDLPVLMRCGLAATVPHAPSPMKRNAHYVTHNEGGAGAVRELCELILTARGDLESMLSSYAT
ncbi:MAG TPA: HAD hydrolase family protein [Casimicrobiaceae bacterium]|jgi:3-deoxy-D-manno-octulosonate 8-phosphate phosphatase (KDO 8-P phosphatase)